MIIPGGYLETSEQALNVYRDAYKATLTDTLGESYEGVWSVLGDRDFFALADAFIYAYPSLSYNLSDYGKQLPEFLELSLWQDTYPFLSDLARFDWAFKEVFHGVCPSMDSHLNFQNISSESKFKFLSSVRFLSLRFSVYDIWKQRKSNVDRLTNKLDSPEHLILYKGSDDKVWVVRLELWQFDLLSHLYMGQTLVEALNTTLTKYDISDSTLIHKFFAEVASYSFLIDFNQ